MIQVRIRTDQLARRADQAMRRTVVKLGEAIQDGFDDPRYIWPGVTKRRSGAVAGTRRDVVDLGTLKGSQTTPVRLGGGRYRLEWQANYAAAVFLGAVFRKRRGVMPARNVPMNVLRDFEFARTFGGEW